MKSHFSILRALFKTNEPPKLKFKCFIVSLLLMLCFLSSTNGFAKKASFENSEALLCPNSADFIFTKVICDNSTYTISVLPVNSGTHLWAATVSGGTTQTSTSSNPTFVLSQTSNYITVSHRITIGGVTTNCTQSYNIICRSSCDSMEFSHTIINCNSEFTLPNASYGGTIYWDFGDGTTTSSSSGNILHHYSTPGTYNVCLTQVWGESIYSTCCQNITITSCSVTCDSTRLMVTTNDTCSVVLTFISPFIGDHFKWVITNSSSTVFTFNTTEPILIHDFPSGPYSVCITMYYGTDSLYCCFIKEFPDCHECCRNADFSISKPDPHPSCVNEEYIAVSDCRLENEFVQHHWIFSDGTTYDGINPPTHTFTNFVDSTGEVCITHIVTCGGIPLTPVTICTTHVAGAYLGLPGESLNMTDAIPLPWGPTVYNFITKYSHTPSIPLYIDGNLIVNQDVQFSGGIWYMEHDSKITVDNKGFFLNGTTIQSAARLGKACCFWAGVESLHSSKIRWINVNLNDADYVIHYPSFFIKAIPVIWLENCTFIENRWGLVSQGQFFKVARFSNNEFVGFPYPDHLCSCISNNAIDLRDINGTMSFPKAGSVNKISYYEQGFHVENTSLQAENFELSHLDDWGGVNGYFGDGIGIYYRNQNKLNSILKFDYFDFSHMRTGVKEDISFNNHTLNAEAYVDKSSIHMDELWKGYDINVLLGKLTARINNNYISTTGGDYENFGVKASMFGTSINDVTVDNNQVLINSGQPSLGISVYNSNDNDQNVKISHNSIDLASTGAGTAILVDKCRQSRVTENIIDCNDDYNGIEINDGGYSIISCNHVSEGKNGMYIAISPENSIHDNVLYDNPTALHFNGDCMGPDGSRILLNTFHVSLVRGILYDKTAETGVQFHNNYNSWLAQDGLGAEHVGPIKFVKNCRLWAPTGSSTGTVHNPTRSPAGLVDPSGPSFMDLDLCEGGTPPDVTIYNPIVITPTDTLPTDTLYARLVRDADLPSVLTGAEYANLLQSIGEYLDENPSWTVSSATLGSFVTDHASDFIGESVSIRQRMKQLTKDIDDQHVALATLQSDRQVIIDDLTSLYNAVDTIPDTTLLNTLAIAIASDLSDISVLDVSINSQQAIDEAANGTELTSIETANAALDDTEIYMEYEKTINDFTIKCWNSFALSAGEVSTLRNIAQTCYSEGGRAVYYARGLCLSLLNEYYSEDGCITSSPKPGTKISLGSGNSLSNSNVRFSPNPVNEQLKLIIPADWNTEKITEISIVDAMGRIISVSPKWINNYECFLNASDLTEGLYLAIIKNGYQNQIIKFVVKH